MRLKISSEAEISLRRLFSDVHGPSYLQALRDELRSLDLDAQPLQLELAYARVESHCAEFEAAMIEDGKANGTHCQGNSYGGSTGGGAGWVYGWTLRDDRVKWCPKPTK